jgi:hypothetical protein
LIRDDKEIWKDTSKLHHISFHHKSNGARRREYSHDSTSDTKKPYRTIKTAIQLDRDGQGNLHDVWGVSVWLPDDNLDPIFNPFLQSLKNMFFVFVFVVLLAYAVEAIFFIIRIRKEERKLYA